MLYYLFNWLNSLDALGANLFRYFPVRSILAFFIAFLLVLIFEPRFISYAKIKWLGQPIRDDGPQTHLTKKGTPTMGGMVVVGAVCIAGILLCDLLNPYVWITLGVFISYAFLGFKDDYVKVSGQNSKGVSAKEKLRWQFATAFIAGLLLYLIDPTGYVQLPFFKTIQINLSLLYIPFAMIVIVGTSNAVNLTDGLDGLVTGPVIAVAITYGIFAYVAGDARESRDLLLHHVSGASDLTIICGAIIGAGLGFLWYNSYPAQVFMGDVGALALGGALGVIALIVKQELILILAGGLFVAEAVSVFVQVFFFKRTGKRVLRMAPLHHHFELGGIPETKIIVRFWIISILLAVFSLLTLKIR